MTPTQPETDQKHIAEFAALLVQHLEGRAHEQISQEMHELLAAVSEHGRKGSLTITVTVEPPKGNYDGGPLAIAIDSAVKAPKPVAPPSIYFRDRDGNASRHDPRQTAAFEVRDLPTSNEIKEI
ncbi:hypothetical protein [Streptomyces sp. NPDC096153]|uniref:hypothetical protein n=1 Tax=Streptomyces sp. NPDC096153 TaxID=3155548 RepID=UPI003317AE3B